MASSKIQALLDQKKKLEEQIKSETEKCLVEVGKIAKKSDILHWSKESLTALFNEAKEKGEEFYSSLTKENENNNQPESDNQHNQS
jgi:hypothetical protein|tara:strand:- start:11812 stop:12069 length:258 start_codon:yes stop_codon:yes gene_type:complete